MYIPTPKKKPTPPTKPKGIVIGVIAASATLISEEDEPTSRADDVIPLPADVRVGELSKEEQLVVALKASIDKPLESGRLNWRASFMIELQVIHPFFELSSHFII